MNKRRKIPWRRMVAAPTMVALAIASSNTQTARYLEDMVARPLEFQTRSALRHDPGLAPNLKLFAFDDATYAAARFAQPDSEQWLTLLESLVKSHPSAIIIDSVLARPPTRGKGLERTLNQIVFSGVPIASLLMVTGGGIPLQPVPQSAVFPLAVPAMPAPGTRAVGADPALRAALRYMGHFADAGAYRFRPVLPIGDGTTAVLHLATFATRQWSVAHDGSLVIDHRPVPHDNEGRVLVNFLPQSALGSALISLKTSVASAELGEANPYIERGDVVVILTRHMTGLNETVTTPYGRMYQSQVAAMIVNTYMTGAWLTPVAPHWSHALSASLAGFGLGMLSPLLFWLALVGVTLTISGAALLAFSMWGLVLPWLIPLAVFATSALVAFVATRWRAERDRLRLTGQLEAAATIQQQYLPAMDYEDSTLALAAYYRPADGLAGDWFSYYRFRGGWFHLHLGDVTGHGIDSALLSTFAKGASDMTYSLRVGQGADVVDLAEIHGSLNRMFAAGGPTAEKHMTLTSIAINTETGETLYLNSGSHPPLVVAAGDERPRALVMAKASSILGFDPHRQDPVCGRAWLNGSETILIFSDGLLANPRHWQVRSSVRSLTRLLKEYREQTPSNMRRLILSSLGFDGVRGGTEDDVTFVAVKLSFTARKSAREAS